MTDDIFAPIKASTAANQRKAIRYTSSSNKAVVTLKHLFRSRKYINIEVINISSRGARITSKYKLSIKTKIIFNLKIKGRPTWKVPAKVVRIYGKTEYGLIFDKIQHDLIDQVMKNEDDFAIARQIKALKSRHSS